MREQRGTLERAGIPLAWAALEGDGPTVVFLGGFRSDMEGGKALHLRDRCGERGRAFLRLDYAGHGTSGGLFEDGTIGRWLDDAATVIDHRAPGPVVLVGSSMGGWIALLLARRWGAERVRAVLGIAAAPDFTEELIPAELTGEEREVLARYGVVRRPSPYGEPMPITSRLLEEGRDHLILREPLDYHGPVRLLQGMRDTDVPWQHALRIAEVLQGGDVAVTLVKDGDHRLSRDSDLDRLWHVLEPLLPRAG